MVATRSTSTSLRTKQRRPRRLITRLQSAAPTFSFLHLAKPDSAGHTYGFMSRGVRPGRRRDGRLGRAGARLPSSRKCDLSGTTTVIVTTDHGGYGHHSFGCECWPANYTVPFFVWGAGRRLPRQTCTPSTATGQIRELVAPLTQQRGPADPATPRWATSQRTLLGLDRRSPASHINIDQSLDVSLS